ncbi:restriction endonuclease subunit S [Vibrio sp.]|uniref:restriction endonuclease subunit S n=1 Tax=Vibrio sp. TaxID=678 RepID=UPI003F6D9A73
MTEQVNVPKLRFSEFYSQWESKNLGELSTIRSASRVHREQWTESGVPFFRSSDVVSAYKGADNTKAFISKELFEELSKKSGKPKKNDLLVTGGGSIGIPYLIPDDEPLYFKDADLLWFKNQENLNGYFLYQFLITSTFRRYLESITHTGTISHYTIEQAKSTPMSLPAIPEQQKIASFLSKVDEKIGLLTEKKDKLTEYKRGVMQQLFNGKWQEQDGQLTFVPPTLRFKADDGSEFPDWEERTMASLFPQIRNGFVGTATPFYALKNDGIKYLQGKNIKKNQIHSSGLIYVNSAFHTKNTKSQLKEHDIVMVQSGHVGECARITKEFEGANCHALLVSTPNLEKVNSCFFVYYFYSRVGKKQIHKITTGNTIKHILGSDLKEIKVNSPSLSEQTKIANFLTAIDHKLELASTEIEKAKEWKKGLLQQMFV